MRTTVNLDEDVLLAVKERAERERRSAGEILSELARAALIGQHRPIDAPEVEGTHGFEPLPHRGPTVSNAFIDRLREDEPD